MHPGHGPHRRRGSGQEGGTGNGGVDNVGGVMVGCWYKDWLKRGIYAARGVTVIVGVLPDGGILVSVATTAGVEVHVSVRTCLLYTSPSPRD